MIGWLYVVATALILIGFAMLCQPLSAWLYASGFPVLLCGVVLHIVLDHVPQRDDQTNVDD